MTTLDDKNQIQLLDESNMAKFILELPEQIEKSLQAFDKLEIPENWKKIKNICMCGMGGSAMAGWLLKNLPHAERKIPIQIIRNYDLPNWVDDQSLVICVSHSGDTQETLSAFDKAQKRTKNVLVVSTGGKLTKLAEKNKVLSFKYETPAEPRASLGYLLGAIFTLFKKLNLIESDLSQAVNFIKKTNSDFKPEIKCKENLAKNLAYCCLDRLPIVVSSGILTSVAWRWKTQINENANTLAFTEFLPEAMHNAVQGLDFPLNVQENLIYILLKNSFDSSELILQFKKLEKLLQQKNIRYETVEALGDDVWSQKLFSLILGDWVSFYLAMLNNVDPTPVKTIEILKK